jgi:ribosomal protein S18 acetylase RimI-like enzyme
MKFEVRTAEKDDAPAIANLIEEVEKFYTPADVQPLEERIVQVEEALFGTPPLASALLAETESGDLVGFASYSYLWPAAGSTHSLFLKELYIREHFRGHGIGRRLMRRLQEIAADRPGCSRIEWMTDRSNDGARSFYRDLGIEEFDGKVVYRQIPEHR